MHKMAVIGGRDLILGLRALGVETFPVEDRAEAGPVLSRLVKEGFAIIFITESLARDLLPQIAKYGKETLPCITIIPDARGSTGLGLTRMQRIVEKAVGVNLLGKN